VTASCTICPNRKKKWKRKISSKDSRDNDMGGREKGIGKGKGWNGVGRSWENGKFILNGEGRERSGQNAQWR
jgi:hypothetical protein